MVIFKPPATPQATSPGRFSFTRFLLRDQRINRGDVEGAENEANQAVGRNHHKHPEETPEDFSFAFIALGISRLRRDKLKDPPKEDHKGYGKGEIDERVKNVLVNPVEKTYKQGLS